MVKRRTPVAKARSWCPRSRRSSPSRCRHSLLKSHAERQTMKLIVAIIRPDRLNEVLEALYRAEVRGLTLSRVLGHGGETERVETYRGTTVKVGLQEKVRLEIGVSDSFVDITVQAILGSARTGDVGDGKIFVLDVEQVYRIRTAEKNEAAVTPAAAVEA